MRTNWQDDIKNDELPADLDAYEKGPDELKIGQRIGWWHDEDVEFAAETGDVDDLARLPPFSGVVVPRDDLETRSDACELEHLLVVMDRYPVEKCYCETTYIAYRRLIGNERLVKVVLMPGDQEERAMMTQKEWKELETAWKRKEQSRYRELLEKSKTEDNCPENYNGPCWCKTCCSYPD